MPWFKVDDGLSDHPKVLMAGNAAMGLWVRAGAWSMKHLTDGFIPDAVVQLLGTAKEARTLVSAGLWLKADGGFRFHEWRKAQDGDYRPNIRRAVRQAVFERDGNRCVFCGATRNLSLDHIIRYRDDGPDTVENLRVLCMPCNLERG